MKEEVQNGPLMDQDQRQKGITLPQIKTVFGTVEEVLEQRTESNTNTSQDRSGVMSGDEISGMVQDALLKARKATQTLSPHKQSQGTQKPYSSFFPSLENMMSTSRSTTLQHAQTLLNGKTAVLGGTGDQREQPESSDINETTVQPRTSEQTMINTSDYVIRKVEDEIANAKKVAQGTFDRVKGVTASSKGDRGNPQIVDLTDAEDVPTFDNRETTSSTWRSDGLQSTWKSADSEGQLDSMMSEDYELVYEYSAAPSMSSVGQPSAFCSLDNPIIRVMEHTVAGMNIIDLTNVEDASSPPQSPRGLVQHLTVSASQYSVVSTGTEENGGLNTIEKFESSKESANKTPDIKPYPVLPVSQERIVNDSQKIETEKVDDTQTTPVVSKKQESSRVERLRKLKQPMNIVKEESRDDSQVDDQLKMSLDLEAESPANECMGENTAIEQKDNSEIVDNKKQEATDAEETFFDSMEAAEFVPEEEAVTAETDENEANKIDEKLESADIEADPEPVTDQQVEEALIDSVETDEVVEDATDQQFEAALINLVETDELVQDSTDRQVEEAVIDTVEVVEDSHKEQDESHAAKATTHSDVTEGPLDLASGFDKLLSFFKDRDEKKGIALAKSKEVDSEGKMCTTSNEPVAQSPDTPEEPSTEDANLENHETISDEATDPTKPETSVAEDSSELPSLEESTNDSPESSTEDIALNHDETILDEMKDTKSSEKDSNVVSNMEESTNDTPYADGKSMEELVTPILEEEVSNTTTVASPRQAAADVINALGNFGASHDDGIQVVAASKDRNTGVAEEPADNTEVQHEEGKHPLLSFFDAPKLAFGLGFMASTKNQPNTGATLPQAADGTLEGQQFSAAFTKSGESSEKNSLIEVAATTPSMDGQLMPSPVPSQYTADDERYEAEPGASTHSVGQVEDFRYDAEQEEHDNKEEPAMQFDPLGSLYRAPLPEKELEPESTRVSLKNQYADPPGEYTTRPTEDIINANSVEAPIPQLSVLEPTDEIQKLQASIMGESVTRRFNACGALKMFAMKKTNQLALARTDGFFDALIVALTTDLVGEDREAAFGTRTRALEILLRVCMQKENRVIIFYHPDLVESIVSCAIEDSGEIRMAACSVLAMVAKSGHLREPMAQVDDLLDALADSLLGVDSQKAAPAKNLDEVHENDANYVSDDFSSGSDTSTDDSASESESSYEDFSKRNRQHRQSAKLKMKEMKAKKEETKRQVTTNACAALLHLSKQCAATHFMCHCSSLLNALLILSQQYEHPMHTKCLEILSNLTRLPSNNEILAEHPSVVPVMLRLSTSESEEDRVWALRMLQNISASKAGKQVLVSAFALELLSMSVLRTQAEEQKAAMAALFNLSTDPGCLMAITNTRDVLSSLVLVAQDMNSISEVRMMACDMLATVGLWFQKLAGGATVPNGVKETALPTNVTTGWNRWD